jgi:hypothetical protein
MSQRNDKLTHCSPSENGPVALIVSAILAAIGGGIIGLLLLALFGATAGDYCQCTTSLAQGDDRCHKCGKLLRELPKKGQSK